MYQKVLVPLDGSGIAECVLPHVAAIARGCNVPEVDLLYAVQQPRFPYSEDGFYDAYFAPNIRAEGTLRAGNWGKSYLMRIADELKKTGVQATKIVVLYGDAAEQILEYASKNGVDLIIMSTHGRSGPSRWDFGSTSERVLRRSPVSITLVRPAVYGVAT